MTEAPLLSAIVLNYGAVRARDVFRCVDALRAQTIADQLEIIVVDNHSPDDSMSILEPLKSEGSIDQLLRTEKNRG